MTANFWGRGLPLSSVAFWNPVPGWTPGMPILWTYTNCRPEIFFLRNTDQFFHFKVIPYSGPKSPDNVLHCRSNCLTSQGHTRQHALRKIEGSLALWTCKFWDGENRISKEKTKIFFRSKSKSKVTGVNGHCESSALCMCSPNMTVPTPSLQPQTNLTWIYM